MTDILERSREINWYHSLELAPGQLTDGMYDLRPYVERYGIPERLDGLRVLDVGTFDGFWAFELERRGAEVVALDLEDRSQLDYPPRRRPKEFPKPYRGDGFFLAKEALAMEVPVVATDEVGLPEVVRPAWGALVAPHDPAALAAALRGELDRPIAERATRGAAGRAFVLAHCDVHAEARKLAALIAG